MAGFLRAKDWNGKSGAEFPAEHLGGGGAGMPLPHPAAGDSQWRPFQGTPVLVTPIPWKFHSPDHSHLEEVLSHSSGAFLKALQGGPGIPSICAL